MTESACKRTPLYSWHRQQGASFTDWNGWLVPVDFHACPTGSASVELADISFLGKVELLGPVTPLARILAGNSGLDRPRSVCNVTQLEAVACRLAGDRLLLLAETMQAGWPNAVNRLAADHAVVTWDATPALAAFLLRGRQTEVLLRRLTSLDVRAHSFPPGSCAETALAGVHALLVRLPGSADIRLQVGWDVAEYVWERLLDVGEDLALQAVSWEALGPARSQAAYR